MKTRNIFYILLILIISLASCKNDDMDILVPMPNDINFTDLKLDRFSHIVPDGGFTSGGIQFNTVKNSDGSLKGGFAYSNRSNRSFTWTNTQEALDSNIYSIHTVRPNKTEVYAVCRATEDAFFTLTTPKVIEHMLVGNTTYAYLAMNYGDQFGTAVTDSVQNPNIPSKPMGVWNTHVPGGVKKFVDADKDFCMLTIKGSKGGTETGVVNYYLATMTADAANPTWSRIINDWYVVDLSSLGEVDKLSFSMSSSDKDGNGVMRTPNYFCIDGIRIRK